jgi:alpha-ribazole phosphatase
MAATIITLIRHGKVAGPAGLYGRTDIPLSPAGHSDLMRTLGHIHKHTPIDQLISSPKLRCLRAAKEFSDEHKIALRTEHNLHEMDFGVWDGVPFDELGDQWENIQSFWDSPQGVQPPEGESLSAFASRIIGAWGSILNHITPAHNAIICHGGVIRILIAHLLQLDWRNPALFKQLQIDYASYTRIEIGDHQDAVPVLKWIGAVLQ